MLPTHIDIQTNLQGKSNHTSTAVRIMFMNYIALSPKTRPSSASTVRPPRLSPQRSPRSNFIRNIKYRQIMPLFLSTHSFQVCPPTSSCRHHHPPRHHSSPLRHRRQQRSFRHLATASMRSGHQLEPVASLAPISVQRHIVDLPCRAHRGPLLHLRNRRLQSLQSRNLRHLARSIG